MKKSPKMVKCLVLTPAVILCGIVLMTAGCPDQHPKNPTGWAVGDTADGYGTILHTTDGGNTWVRQGSAQAIPAVFINDVCAVDADNAWVVGDPSDGYGVILRTTDGGQTWVRQGSAEQIPNVGLAGVSAVNNNTAWVAGTEGTVLFTADGGQIWTRQAEGLAPAAELQMVYAVDSKNAWAVGGMEVPAPILRTRDGGNTWVRQGTAAQVTTDHLIDISALDSTTAWAVGGNYTCYQTTDGGANWTNRSPVGGLYDANGVCAVNADTIWFITDNDGIHYSTDRSANWTKQTSPKTGYHLIGVSALDTKTAWVVGVGWSASQKGIILHTADGGDTWTEQTAPVNASIRRTSFVDARK